MWTEIDRVQTVVANAERASAWFRRLLDAEEVATDVVPALGARRRVLRVGRSEIELLEPDGAGAVADHLASGGGLFAAGVAVADLKKARRHLRASGIEAIDHGDQILVPELAPGLRLVVSRAQDRTPAGLLTHLYEVTYLVQDFQAALATIATAGELSREHFVPIRSEEYGYDGVLTLFDPQRLDRIEAITPFDATKTMGRYFAKRGESLYMCFAETDRGDELRARLIEHVPDDWTGPRAGKTPDSLFIHPKALAGLMVGVSRTSFAWIWSGRPDRVVSAAL